METRLSVDDASIIDRCFKHDEPFEQLFALVDTLLWRNKRVADHLDMMNGPTDEPNICQKTLATIALLDVEVPNGGLLQFFWNCSVWMEDVSPSLRNLGLSALADVFERSIADLVEEIGRYP